MPYSAGRHFLQIPGPTNVPERVLRAIDRATIDHRGPDFGALGREVLSGMQAVFRTRSPVVIYPASGTGAWEAALVNALDPGDRVRRGLPQDFLEGGEMAEKRPRRDPDRVREGRGRQRGEPPLADDPEDRPGDLLAADGGGLSRSRRHGDIVSN